MEKKYVLCTYLVSHTELLLKVEKIKWAQICSMTSRNFGSVFPNFTEPIIPKYRNFGIFSSVRSSTAVYALIYTYKWANSSLVFIDVKLMLLRRLFWHQEPELYVSDGLNPAYGFRDWDFWRVLTNLLGIIKFYFHYSKIVVFKSRTLRPNSPASLMDHLWLNRRLIG